jgi:hypothetical protein
MGKLAIRLSILTIGATVLVALPAVAPTKAEARSRHGHVHNHVQKHKRYRGYAGPSFVGEARPVIRPSYQSGEICPGIGRSFECKIWPPPYADDPDRKTSRF